MILLDTFSEKYYKFQFLRQPLQCVEPKQRQTCALCQTSGSQVVHGAGRVRRARGEERNTYNAI